MRKVLSLLLFLLFVGCFKEKENNDKYYECVMINQSGVAVRVEMVENSRYVDFPSSLTLLNGESHTWVVPAGADTKMSLPPPKYPPFGEGMPKEANICFDDKTYVEYSGYEVKNRDPRFINSYVEVNSEKENSIRYVYTFTVEDYQRATKK